MAEGEDKPILNLDKDYIKHDNRFYNIKKMIEEGAGFKGKAPESLEQKLDVYTHMHHPENKYQDKVTRDIGAIIMGGHPMHEKGAKYYAMNQLYKVLGKDDDKLKKDDDIRKVLTPFMDDFIKHTFYEKFKEIEGEIKKGKSDGSKYTEEDIFKMKMQAFDLLINAGAQLPGGKQVQGIRNLFYQLKDKKRIEVETFIDAFAQGAITGYVGGAFQSIEDTYFTKHDEVGIRKYFKGKLKERNLKPKEHFLNLGYEQLLNKYRNLIQKESYEEYVPIKKPEGAQGGASGGSGAGGGG